MIAGILLCVALYYFSKWLANDTKQEIQKDVEAGVGWVYLAAPIIFFYVLLNTKQGFIGSLSIAVIGTFVLAFAKDGLVITPLATAGIYALLAEHFEWFPIFACAFTIFICFSMSIFETTHNILSSDKPENNIPENMYYTEDCKKSEPTSVSSNKVE